MAIDLGISNSIINSYLAGLNQRKADEQELQRRKERQQLLDIEERRFQEGVKREDEKFKYTQQQDALNRKLKGLELQEAFGNLFRTTGQIPTTHKRLPTPHKGETQRVNPTDWPFTVQPNPDDVGLAQIDLGEDPDAPAVFESQDPDIPGFSSQTPEQFARFKASMDEIVSAPAHKRKLEEAGIEALLKEIEAENDQERTLEVEKFRASEAYKRAELAAASREKIATNNNAQQEDRLLNLEELKAYNLPEGSKRSDAFGKFPAIPLSNAQADQDALLKYIEDKLVTAKLKLDEIGYDSYFKGGSGEGLKLDAKRVFNQDRGEDIAIVNTALGDAHSFLATERFGASFTQGEKGEISSFLPGVSHLEPAEDSKVQIEAAIQGIRERRRNLRSSVNNRYNAGGGSNPLDAFVEGEPE